MKHEVKVVQLGPIEPHPNADTLGLTTIDGFTVIVRLAEWAEGQHGVYIEPDYAVPVAPWSEFLGKDRRIKVKRLRGIYSQGLLLPVSILPPRDEPYQAGDDVMESLGITRYEAPESNDDGYPGIPRKGNPGENPHPLLAGLSKYDLESWQKYGRLFDPDEEVVVTEKIHGENARYAWIDDRMWVGSRNRWVAREEWGGHWQSLADNPWIESWCQDHPGWVLYGESFGNVPKMRYGVEPDKRGFLAFDVYNPQTRGFLSYEVIELLQWLNPWEMAPVLFRGKYSDADLKTLAEGKSMLADHVREGCVVKPVTERWNPRVGRLAMKCVGNGFYEKEGKA
jgi:RNA ligase (TIGR02306 family)